MVWRLPTFALMVAIGVASSARAEEFPYTAYINSDDVNLRSGPGENYYPVAKLDRGQAIEVYRHDPGGWYAIRPTPGCFSWVSGEFIRPSGGALGVVIGDRVVARVGSVFDDVRDVIQVRLDRDEEVEILEAREFNSGPAAQTWYKISPPAGEFRWVSGKYVERRLETPPPREPSASNNLLISKLREREGELRETERELDDLRSHLPASERNRERYVTDPNDDFGDRRRRPRERNFDDDDRFADEQQPAPPRSRVPVGMSAELEELELELSTIVSRRTDEWDFTHLRQRVERMLPDATTAVERGRARLMLAKIDRFDDIHQRYVAVADVRNQTDTRNRALASTANSPDRHPYTGDPRYDGTGKLAQVVSNKMGAPRYALLDSTGEVRFYVTAAPGMNLRNYIGKEVGVSGTLGFLPEQQRQHVTAKRIVPLDGTQLR